MLTRIEQTGTGTMTNHRLTAENYILDVQLRLRHGLHKQMKVLQNQRVLYAMDYSWGAKTVDFWKPLVGARRAQATIRNGQGEAIGSITKYNTGFLGYACYDMQLGQQYYQDYTIGRGREGMFLILPFMQTRMNRRFMANFSCKKQIAFLRLIFGHFSFFKFEPYPKACKCKQAVYRGQERNQQLSCD